MVEPTLSELSERATQGELLPCPFCGSDEVEAVGQRFVRCLVCYTEGPVAARIAEAPTAVKLWNTRRATARAAGDRELDAPSQAALDTLGAG